MVIYQEIQGSPLKLMTDKMKVKLWEYEMRSLQKSTVLCALIRKNKMIF